MEPLGFYRQSAEQWINHEEWLYPYEVMVYATLAVIRPFI